MALSTSVKASKHRAWEDWLSMAIGLLVVISPWLAQAADSPLIVINAVIVGLMILSLAGMELIAELRERPQTAEESIREKEINKAVR